MRTDLPSRWFRLYGEFATDPKVQMLSETDQRRYIMLLCLRCSNGDVTLQDVAVTFMLRVSSEEWAKTKAVLVASNLITDDNKPVAWDKRQYASDSSTERVYKHRAKAKKACNVGVTLQSRPVEAETETEIEVNKPSAHDGIVFDGTGFQNLNGYLATWESAYPAINVKAEVTKAAAWLISNPKNKKSNYARFLNAWLSKAQDTAPRVPVKQTTEDWI